MSIEAAVRPFQRRVSAVLAADATVAHNDRDLGSRHVLPVVYKPS
jgi:hypothetical protein